MEEKAFIMKLSRPGAYDAKFSDSLVLSILSSRTKKQKNSTMA